MAIANLVGAAGSTLPVVLAPQRTALAVARARDAAIDAVVRVRATIAHDPAYAGIAAPAGGMATLRGAPAYAALAAAPGVGPVVRVSPGRIVDEYA